MLTAALSAVACKQTKTDVSTTSTEQKAADQKGEVYNIDTQNSTVKWTATHKGGFNPRFGTMTTTGNLTAENEQLTSGTLSSDVNSLTTNPAAVDPATTEGKTSKDLDTHLKSADFFDAAKYPKVTFVITGVKDLAAGTESKTAGANKTVSGNLTIKDKTVNVTFPAKVTVSNGTVTLVSQFTINRDDWGLTYGTDGDPKDWMISQNVDLNLNIVAKK